MATSAVPRNQRLCALCIYWNGAIGSTTIRVQPGAHAFLIDRNEVHDCFKEGVGIQKLAIHVCPYFKPRYVD